MDDTSNVTFRNNSVVGEYARIGALDKLIEAITNGAPVDIPDIRGFYPIHAAASENHWECLKILLRHEKTDVNSCTCTPKQRTALTIAAENGCVECVRLLIECGADVNFRPDSMSPAMSPLMAAIMGGSTDCVEALINAGADVAESSIFGHSPLHSAVFRGFNDIVHLLLSSGVDPLAEDDSGRTATTVACEYGEDTCLKILLDAVDDKEAGVNHRDRSGESCVYHACRYGSESCLKILLENGADVNICANDGGHPIWQLACTRPSWELAVDKNHMECMHLIHPLIDKNVVFHSKLDPVSAAAIGNNLEMLKLLIADGYPVNRLSELSNWSLNYLIGGGYVDYMDLRLSYPLFAKSMTTPLAGAVHRCHLDMVRMLLDAGAEMQPEDVRAFSPFLLAITRQETPQILDEFLKRGVDLNFVYPNAKVQIPDALLVAALPSYHRQLLLMLKAGLKPCLENWCGSKLQTCKRMNFDSENVSFLRKMSDVATPKALEELVRVVLPFSANGLPSCCDAWIIEVDYELPDFGTWQDTPLSLAHLCRIKIRDQLSTKQLYSRDWTEKINLPKRLKNYLIFEDM